VKQIQTFSNNNDAWIEWIPNISTGNEESVLEIQQLLSVVPDLYLLHGDRGPAVNRSVLTMAGTMTSLEEGLYVLMSWLVQNMDMSTHTGTHPRSGAMDVSPFVLLKGGTREKIISWVSQLAEGLSSEFELPVFLYEQSASHPDRSNLADIRKGEYEGLRMKLEDPFWKPDFGTTHNPYLGATVMGVRDFLIAYNVNINTSDIRVAKAIAKEIRARGSSLREWRLEGVKAMGWHLTDAGFCQISTNITQTRITTPLDVFKNCRILAHKMGCEVTGSELIGLIPHHSVSAMLDQTSSTTVGLAGQLGLDYCSIGDLQERMIEHKLYLASRKTIFNEIFDSK